jgi:hypothetical protein
LKKILLSIVTTVAVLLGFGCFGNLQNVQANDLNGLDISRKAKIPVVTTQTSVIYKVRVGKNMAKNRPVSQSTLQKGTKLFSTRYLASSGGYIVYSGDDGSRYNPRDHYFYLVATNSPTAWYKKINFHSGSPSYAHGYWHDRHYTSLIRGTHYWFRISGWNDLGKDKFRFPYHGYDRIHYIQEGNHDLILAYNSQTGFYDYITFKNPGNSNYLLVGSPDSNSYSKLIRGNR